MFRLQRRHRLRIALANPAAGGGEAPAELDADAIARLRELDPQGTHGVVVRVLRAYETALVRQLDELPAGLAADDADRVSRLAHTLKSSSASVGAIALSQLCAEVERSLRTQRPAAIDGLLRALMHEGARVLATVRAMLAA